MTEQDKLFLVKEQLSGEFNIRLLGSQHEWMMQLAAAVNDLIRTDFSRLVQVLYRLDVSEQRLKAVLKEQAGTDAGMLIAALIVERQAEKLRTRQQFRQQGDIPDEERW